MPPRTPYVFRIASLQHPLNGLSMPSLNQSAGQPQTTHVVSFGEERRSDTPGKDRSNSQGKSV